MGKASSAKKIARAARAGGAQKGKRKNLGFPLGVGAILVLGVALLFVSRNETSGAGPPRVDDHWHASYGVYLCDRFVANLADRGTDKLGIHTHEDGLIHVHPFLGGAEGRNATVGRFLEQTGLKLTDSRITLPPGSGFKNQQYVEGETECGGKGAKVEVAHWDDATKAADSKPDKIFTTDFSAIRLDEDKGAYTFAFVPEGTDIPAPPGAASIATDGAKDGAPGQQVPSSTDPGGDPGAGDPGAGDPGVGSDPGAGSEPAPPSDPAAPGGSAPPTSAAP